MAKIGIPQRVLDDLLKEFGSYEKVIEYLQTAVEKVKVTK